MLIDFESSGGIAGLQLSYHANTETLPPGTAAEIAQLVKSSGVLNLTQADIPPTPPGGADFFTYTLSLRDGSQQTTLAVNDMTAPPSLRPLLSLLQKLAVDEKLKGR